MSSRFSSFVLLVARSSKSIFAFLMAVLVFVLAGCSESSVINKISAPTMGTEYHISWVSNKQGRAALDAEKTQVQDRVDALLIDFNKTMSTYDPASELSMINKAAQGADTEFHTNWQMISADLYRVLAMSKQLNQYSNGAFDVTVGPLVNLWGFGPIKSQHQVPKQGDIHSILQQVGSDVINLRQTKKGFELQLSSQRYIDLSAIAKGDAVDVLGLLLQQQGIENYLVEVGGEIIAHGQKPENQPWRIAIEAPIDDGRSAQIIIPLSNVGVATSGDYRNFFEKDGQRYSHTIDGRTGYPVEHNLASVSVLHESVAMADAWATALTVLGAEEGLKLAEEHSLAAYFIVRTDKGFEQFSSSRFEQLRLN